MEYLRKLFRSYNKKEPDAEESDDKKRDALTSLAAEYAKNQGDKEVEDPSLQKLIDNPMEALENNEKLRNAFLKKQKELGLNILDLNIEPSEDANTTDLSKIELNSKIHIALNNNNARVNLLLIGKSGCGQTSFISYLTRDQELEGDDTMFAQRFNGVTFDLQIQGGNANVTVHESPGMCSGFDVPQLGEHWNKLIATVNGQGGVSIFLLLIKSNERVTTQFIDELEEFSQLYFDDKQMFWERTVVIFTAIDQLTECDTFQDRVDKVAKQVNMRGLEKLKRVIDLTGTQYLYVSCFDEGDKQRIINDLTNMIASMLTDSLAHTKEIDNLEPVCKTEENIKFTPFVATKPHHIMQYGNDARLELASSKAPPINQCNSCDILTESGNVESSNTLMSEPCSVYRTVDLNGSDAFDMNFLQELERDQLILLLKDICQDGRIYRKCKVRHSQLFAEKNLMSQKRKSSERRKNGIIGTESISIPQRFNLQTMLAKLGVGIIFSIFIIIYMILLLI